MTVCFCFRGLDGERYWCDACKAEAKARGGLLPASEFEFEIHPVFLEPAALAALRGTPDP